MEEKKFSRGVIHYHQDDGSVLITWSKTRFWILLPVAIISVLAIVPILLSKYWPADIFFFGLAVLLIVALWNRRPLEYRNN